MAFSSALHHHKVASSSFFLVSLSWIYINGHFHQPFTTMELYKMQTFPQLHHHGFIYLWAFSLVFHHHKAVFVNFSLVSPLWIYIHRHFHQPFTITESYLWVFPQSHHCEFVFCMSVFLRFSPPQSGICGFFLSFTTMDLYPCAFLLAFHHHKVVCLWGSPQFHYREFMEICFSSPQSCIFGPAFPQLYHHGFIPIRHFLSFSPTWFSICGFFFLDFTHHGVLHQVFTTIDFLSMGFFGPSPQAFSLVFHHHIFHICWSSLIFISHYAWIVPIYLDMNHVISWILRSWTTLVSALRHNFLFNLSHIFFFDSKSYFSFWP